LTEEVRRGKKEMDKGKDIMVAFHKKTKRKGKIKKQVLQVKAPSKIITEIQLGELSVRGFSLKKEVLGRARIS